MAFSARVSKSPLRTARDFSDNFSNFDICRFRSSAHYLLAALTRFGFNAFLSKKSGYVLFNVKDDAGNITTHQESRKDYVRKRTERRIASIAGFINRTRAAAENPLDNYNQSVNDPVEDRNSKGGGC